MLKKDKMPSVLNSKTPQWFKDWHSREYWHFKYDMETKVSRIEKLYWALFGAIIAAAVAQIYL